MTALKKYLRLESAGLWRDAPDAQRREVVVGFRNATLVLYDPKTDRPLTHWSLPALARLNPGSLPALYAPDPVGDETLELTDAEMIDALETVLGAVRRRVPRPGRLRGVLTLGLTLGVAVAALVFLPDALVRQSARMLPFASRAVIGQAALADVVRLTGQPCASPLGDRALVLLSERVFGPGGPRLLVMREGVRDAVHLPGGLILLSAGLLRRAAGPDVAAGFALAEAQRAAVADPVLPVLFHAGLWASLRLLASGSFPGQAMAGYGETILTAPPLPVAPEALLAAFEEAQVASTPYAFALDPSGETTLPLIEADPFRGVSPEPVLTGADWASLRAICD